MNTEAARYPGYRWVVLLAAWLVAACVWWGWMVIPSLAFRLFPELNLTHMQFMLLFAGPFLLPIVSAIPGGALGDRYGIRLIVAIGIFLAGAVGLARVFASNFAGACCHQREDRLMVEAIRSLFSSRRTFL